MYSLVGDYVRIGDSKRDPLHSTLVAGPNETNVVLSMNRCDRQMWLHVWQVVRMADGTPDQLHPVGSFKYDKLGVEFKQDERARRAQ